MRGKNLPRLRPVEWIFPRQQIIGQHAHTVDIAAGIELRDGGSLLRRHERRRPDHTACLRQASIVFPQADLNKAEVKQLDEVPDAALLSDDDVRRLDVAMDDAECM